MADSQPNPWEDLLDTLSNSGGGQFFFPKKGKTSFRIVPEDWKRGKDARRFFTQVDNMYRGQPKTKFIIRAVIGATSSGEISELYADKVVPLVIAKSAFTQILQILADGDADLFSLDTGTILNLNKSGEGKETTYVIIPTVKVKLIDFDEIEDASQTLEEWAQAYTERENARAGSSSSDASQSSNDDLGW